MDFINTIHDMFRHVSGVTKSRYLHYADMLYLNILNVQEHNNMRTRSMGSRVLLQKLIRPQLVKKGPSFYETRNYYRTSNCPLFVYILDQMNSFQALHSL